MDLLSLSSLELRQLCYFLTVVETQNSFSRAAERLHIEQPPLSQRVRALEKRLKVQLFDRRRRPLRLTAAGEVFYQEAREALVQLDRAIAQAQRAEKGEIGHLSVGVASSIANGILPDLVRSFCHRYPQADLELRELTAEQQLEAVGDRRLDLGIEVFPALALQRPELRHRVIAQESLVAVLPEDHVLTQQPEIQLRSLADQPLILPSPIAFPFYAQFLEKCEEAGFQPQRLQQTQATWMLTLLSLVAAGLGIAILPSNVNNLRRQGVLCRPIQDLDLERKIVMVWHRDNHSTTVAHFTALPVDDAAQGGEQPEA